MRRRPPPSSPRCTRPAIRARRRRRCPGVGLPPAKQVEGWVVRPVDRDEHLPPKRYESGLVLSVEGAFHQLENVARGYGTRDFPAWEHTVAPEPVAMPVEARLIAELGALLAANGLDSRWLDG